MRIPVLLLIAASLLSSVCVADAARTDWFQQAKYGVFCHFLGGGPEWNAKIDSFDVTAFAHQMNQVGAGYVMFTLGQNSGYYAAPNATYDKYCGHQSGDRCSRRDLPMELADALAKHDIRLMLYLPSRSPQQDKEAMKALKDVHQNKSAPQLFTRRWSAIIREWSLRYGTKVSGWWFDGSYNTRGWDDLTKRCNWNTWADACRAGNQDSILAFNPGADIKTCFTRLTGQQDYTAGEQNTFEATPAQHPAAEGLQWQLLCHLSSGWGTADAPQKSDAAMIDYIRTVNTQGGVVSMDVHVADDGTVYGPHLAQLTAIGQALRN